MPRPRGERCRRRLGLAVLLSLSLSACDWNAALSRCKAANRCPEVADAIVPATGAGGGVGGAPAPRLAVVSGAARLQGGELTMDVQIGGGRSQQPTAKASLTAETVAPVKP